MRLTAKDLGQMAAPGGIAAGDSHRTFEDLPVV